MVDAYQIIFVILILIFIKHGILHKDFTCENTIPAIAYRSFIHVDLTHLLVNLYALYVLSRVEKQIGFANFLILILVLLVISTLIDFWASKLINYGCSIGFSGILFGILAWEMVTGQEVDLRLLGVIFYMVLQPSLRNPRASFQGHLIGAISGVIVGMLWKNMIK